MEEESVIYWHVRALHQAPAHCFRGCRMLDCEGERLDCAAGKGQKEYESQRSDFIELF